MGTPVLTKLGVHPNKGIKEWMLGAFRQMVYAGTLTVRSREAIDEMRRFVYTDKGSIEHTEALKGDGATGKTNHGDRASALALCAVGLGGSGMRLGQPITEARPLGDFGRRLVARQRALAQARNDEGW